MSLVFAREDFYVIGIYTMPFDVNYLNFYYMEYANIEPRSTNHVIGNHWKLLQQRFRNSAYWRHLLSLVLTVRLETTVADPRGGGWGGLNPQRKKSSSYLGVSLCFGDILSEKQCPICRRLHEKAFGNQKYIPRPLTVKYIFFQI